LLLKEEPKLPENVEETIFIVLPESNKADTETEPIDTGKYTSLPCIKESTSFRSLSP
jgi:hypothetical protein